MNSDNSFMKALPIIGSALVAGALGFAVSKKADQIIEKKKTKSFEKELPLFYSYNVDYSMFREHREKILGRMSKLGIERHGAIILQGGDETRRYDTDAGQLFRQESFFLYLFGVTDPGYFGVIDLDNKKTILFCPRPDDDYELWCGKAPTKEMISSKYLVDEVFFVDEIFDVLKKKGIATLYRLFGVNTDSHSETVTTADFSGIDKFTLDDSTLYAELVECRVLKTKKELDIMRYISKVSSEAHVEVMKRVVPGMFEYQMESIFLHECYFRGGARFSAYVCICGSGHSGASLHYGTNDKKIKDGHIILNDMGAEYHGYAADITCSFPANGIFTDKQKLIYNAVLASHDAVASAMKPGLEWKDMHTLSHRVLTEKLLEEGLFVNGSVDDLMAANVSTYFYQHGLGHLIGLDVHDVGGYPEGTVRSDEPGLRYLRCGRKLEEGMCLTIEPGCYFIDAFIDQVLSDPATAKYINKELVNSFRGFGGVRIESDVVVTKSGIEILTDVPRKVEEIEGVMQKGKWVRA